ncbi:MAG: FtsQ-type POTRA domain-containing protein [Xanthomonadales bacterium]|nr:FtsQ-type POTRA domain-containing protein [Xanthomonadales bacterium]
MSARKPWLLPVLLLAMAALALPLVGMMLARDSSALAPVRWIEVTGPFERITAEQVRTAVAPALRGGFFFLPLDEIRDRVSAMNWADRVEVRKRWPDTVEVRLSERRVLARLGRERLIDRDGRVFDADSHVPMGGIPRFEVSEQRVEDALALYELVRPGLESLGLELARLSLSERGGAALTTAEGLEIVIGRSAHQQRWARLVHGLPLLRLQQDGDPERIDLRYTNGFAVRWHDPNATAAPPGDA